MPALSTVYWFVVLFYYFSLLFLEVIRGGGFASQLVPSEEQVRII